MAKTVVTGSPGFISIAVTDVADRGHSTSATSEEIRDTFDFGPNSAVFVGWPTLALSSARPPGQPGPSPETASIQLWWRASDAQALHDQAAAEGVPIIVEPFEGPFGRTFAMADPDGYRITIYERDQPLFWPPRPG